jgi:predicted TIM-barrel fold metal-dependent hydrolase
VRSELQQIDPARDTLTSRTPIVDIHTHSFNARYLPLKGIVLGKRDAFPPLTWLVSDRCAETLARALVDRTELGAAAGQPAVPRRYRGRQLHETGREGFVCEIFLRLLNKAADAGCWDKSLSVAEQMRRVDAVADGMNAREQLAITAAARMMGMEDRLEAPDRRGALRGVVRFLWTLTQSDAEMSNLFRFAYEDAPGRGSTLIVSHMMDLAPVYDQAPDREALLDFESQQLRRIEDFQRRPDSDMIYFVAFNPYRDHWHGGQPGDGLRLVRQAVENHGAWGVKIYPPSGYRPADNEIKSRARSLLSRSPGRQWDARYGSLGMEGERALDRRLEEVLLWCIARDVPVFTHCGTGEFEARKGYGLHHSHPRFWRRFLETHPAADGSPCRLRLCLGHAGGEDFWFGRKTFPDWGREVYELCTRFPNVYCEISTHAELLEPDCQAYFVDHLAALFAESAQAPYPFATKLVYGTDWYLPVGADPHQILKATQGAFLHPRLRAHYEDYFFANALRYLGAHARYREGSLPRSVRDRLGPLVDR